MNGIKLFNDLMEYADGKGASDVHLVPGRTAMLRIDGELTAAGQEDAAEWQDGDLTEVTEQILSGDQLEEYRTKGALVCSYSFSKALRLRVSVYRQQGRDAMSVRLHPAGVPMPEKLLLPEEITELVKNGRGLLLVTGGRGSGVTTTVALLHLVQCGGSTSGSQILLESLAQGLAGAMAQKLLRRQDEAGRVAAYEVLVADAGVRSLIAENRIQQLDTSAGAEKERGRVQMDDAIYNLYMKS